MSSCRLKPPINFQPTRDRGFTLIELLMVIGILAVLTALVAPPMQNVLEKNRVESHLQNLRSAINFARGEAASRGEIVVICGSNAGSTDCAATNNWANGWLVFVDNDLTLTGVDTSAGDEIIRVFDYTGGNVLTVTEEDGTTALNLLAFNPRGYSLNSQSALLKICPASNDVMHVRAVMISPTGRALNSRDIDNDRIHDYTVDDGQGSVTTSALTCP